MVSEEHKKCTKCGIPKTLSQYQKHASGAGGLRARCKTCCRRSARRGDAPEYDMTKMVPEGFRVKGVSSLYDKEGNLTAQWVKSAAEYEDRIEAVLEAVQEISNDFRGMSAPVTMPEVSDEDLLVVIPFGDPHVGMHAWAEEAGENFDVEIAERDLITAVDHLMSLAPPAKQVLLASLGDMFHADGKNATTTAGTRVDVDSRWAKVLGVGIRAMRRIIDKALEKHETVYVICASGNHDDLSSFVLAVCLSQYYEKEPRVHVDTSPSKYYWHRFGKVLIGVHHGDTTKAKDLPGVMACDRAKDWGETEHRYWLCGHIHHETVKEYPGVIVESFRTLAPKDAWHAAAGYRSGRDLKMDVYHREHGRINRHQVGIQQVRSLQKK